MKQKAYGLWDEAWQFGVGCNEDLPCAARCWAKRIVNRLAGSPNPKVAEAHSGLIWLGGRAVSGGTIFELQWTGKVRLNEAHLLDPLKRRTPTRYAAGFHCDWALLSQDDLNRVVRVMCNTPQDRYFTLTKRPELLVRKLAGWSCTQAFPFEHIYLGISCSDQSQLDERMQAGMRLAAAGWNVWLMAEPLLGPVDLHLYMLPRTTEHHGRPYTGSICGVIVGGESGPGARPMHPDWVRRIRDECQAARVPFTFKQHGDWLHDSQFTTQEQRLSTSLTMHTWPDGTDSVNVGKRAAGHLLDGREWREFPALPGRP